MVRVKMFHFVWFFVHFYKLIRRPPGPLWGGGVLLVVDLSLSCNVMKILILISIV